MACYDKGLASQGTKRTFIKTHEHELFQKLHRINILTCATLILQVINTSTQMRNLSIEVLIRQREHQNNAYFEHDKKLKI